MALRIALTGFGPFRNITQNPSQALVERIGLPNSLILDVTYATALGAELPDVDLVLALGVHGRDDRIWLETTAHRQVSPEPDVAGTVGSEDMLPPGPAEIASPTFDAAFCERLAEEKVVLSNDAGGYLCNYWYYTLLAKGVRAGFIHVPNSEISGPDKPHLGLDEQERLVRRIIALAMETA